MAKYRKKPVEVEAVKWDGNRISEVTDWVSKGLEDNSIFRMGDKVLIKTLEGDMQASPGDYIIRGINGELYPCKPDIFEKTYDPVKDSEELKYLTYEGDVENASDGYHTFKELYEYRMLYNAAFFNSLAKMGSIGVYKSKNHSDGTVCFDGTWFIVIAILPTGQITNHYELKYWDLFDIPEVERPVVYDGHTPQDVANRLFDFLSTPQTTDLSFGEAVSLLEKGKALRRKGWNGKGLFVIKQVPAHIEKDIIPKMQSLPQSAKDLILEGKGFIDYSSQCLIYNENTGRADSWVPSISDVFAKDWELVK